MYLDITGMTLGEQTRLKRVYEGKKQIELATELQLPLAYLSQFENNRKILGKENLERINQYLYGSTTTKTTNQGGTTA